MGDGKVEVTDAEGAKEVYSAKHVIIATGSRPRDIPVLPIDEERVWSSTGRVVPDGGARVAGGGGRRRRRHGVRRCLLHRLAPRSP